MLRNTHMQDACCGDKKNPQVNCSPTRISGGVGGASVSRGNIAQHTKRVFGRRRDEVTGEWRRLHNAELNDLYSSPNIVRVIKSIIMRWDGHVALMGEERGVYRVLVGKLEGKRPLGRPRRRWVDNIRMDLQEVACGWTGLGWPRIRTGGARL